MNAKRWLVSAAILAAPGVTLAQNPVDTPKADPPGATREYRITVNQAKGAQGTNRDATAKKPATVTVAPQQGASQRSRLMRLQEATRALGGETAKGQSAKLAASPMPEGNNAEILNRVLRLSEGKPNDPHREILLRLRAVANESCVQCHAGGVTVRNDDALGLSLVPADDTLRAQLKLDGKGLVVTTVEHGSSGDAGGIREKDIVVALAGKPVATVDDFQKAIKEAGVGTAEGRREPIALKVVRAGEARELRVPPPGAPSLRVGALKVTPVRPNPASPSYWIGVAIGEVDDTLRAHLKLEEKAGLVLTDVIKESPAAKVGLAKNDVLLSVDGKPVQAPEDLVKAVQAAKDEADLKLLVRRAGDQIALSVRPEKRKETVAAATVATSEVRLSEAPQAWVTSVMPFLDGNMNQINWATPGQPGLVFLGNGNQAVPYYPFNAPLADAQKKAADAEAQKTTEALNRQLSSIHQALTAQLKADEAQRKAMTDLVSKAAAPPETLARIDAQLKALEAQVGEIKRSMDDLKAAIKKESR